MRVDAHGQFVVTWDTYDTTDFLFDVVGRRITTLIDGERPAGLQQARWDGHDDRGMAVREGLYFARLRWSGGSRTIRLIRVR